MKDTHCEVNDSEQFKRALKDPSFLHFQLKLKLCCWETLWWEEDTAAQ